MTHSHLQAAALCHMFVQLRPQPLRGPLALFQSELQFPALGLHAIVGLLQLQHLLRQLLCAVAKVRLHLVQSRPQLLVGFVCALFPILAGVL